MPDLMTLHFVSGSKMLERWRNERCIFESSFDPVELKLCMCVTHIDKIMTITMLWSWQDNIIIIIIIMDLFADLSVGAFLDAVELRDLSKLCRMITSCELYAVMLAQMIRTHFKNYRRVWKVKVICFLVLLESWRGIWTPCLPHSPPPPFLVDCL